MARKHKFAAVAERLQQRIESGQYPSGEPMPSEQALANEFGVNRLTLRKALSVLEQDQFVTRKHGCGTFARAAAPQTRLASVVYVGRTQSHFYDTFYNALCGEAQDRGYAITACLPQDDRQLDALAELLAENPRLICMDSHWASIQAAVPADCHVTHVSAFHSIRSLPKGCPGHAISTDTFRAAALATEHLIDLGHRHIGYIDVGYSPPTPDALFGQIRARHYPYLGYRSALLQAGIQEDWPIAIVDPPGDTAAEMPDHTETALRHYLAHTDPPPTAYLCIGDFRAAALYRVLRDHGLRPPHDVSVIGVGNTPWSQYLEPQLTSVCLGETELAHLALLCNAEPEPLSGRVLRVDPHLVERASTAPPTTTP